MGDQQALLPKEVSPKEVSNLVAYSRSVSVRRVCVVEVTNLSNEHQLSNLVCKPFEGRYRDPPNLTIPCNSVNHFMFTKIALSRHGTSGLFSYTYGSNAENTELKRFIVFWHVPLIGPNKFGIGFTTVIQNCADAAPQPTTSTSTRQPKCIYRKMYEQFLAGSLPAEQFIAGDTSEPLMITHKKDKVKVNAIMGDNQRAILKAEFQRDDILHVVHT